MEKVEYLDLWRYRKDYHGQDCDGSHTSRIEFLAVERPNEVVYDEADLFGDAGPSNVTLVDGSNQDAGTAYVSTGTEEGHSSYDISWWRVTKLDELAEFLDTYEKEGPRIYTGFYYTDLYRKRIAHLIRQKFPEAMSAYFKPPTRRGELWPLVEVRGLDERNCPTTFWEGGELPFEEDVHKQISHDLEQVFEDLAVGDTEPVSVNV